MKVTSEKAKSIAKKIGIDWSKVDFPLEQFRRGVEVEFEHGSALGKGTDVGADDPAVSGRIAWAHLKELPDYYTRLDKMEEEGEEAMESKTAFDEGYRVGVRTAMLDAGLLTKEAGVKSWTLLPGLFGLGGAGIGALADDDAGEGALIGGLTGAGIGLGGRALGGIPVRSGMKKLKELGGSDKIERLFDQWREVMKTVPEARMDPAYLPTESLQELMKGSKRIAAGATIGYPAGWMIGGMLGHGAGKKILGREDEED
jgi:hypothetical protein